MKSHDSHPDEDAIVLSEQDIEQQKRDALSCKRITTLAILIGGIVGYGVGSFGNSLSRKRGFRNMGAPIAGAIFFSTLLGFSASAHCDEEPLSRLERLNHLSRLQHFREFS